MNKETTNDTGAITADEKPEISEVEKERLKTELQEYLAKAQEARKETVKITSSEGLGQWFVDNKVSLMFSTGKTSKLFSIGVTDENKVSVGERHFDQCGPVAFSGTDSLYLATQYQIWRLENAVPPGKDMQGFDRFYIPQQSFVTANLGIQDLTVDSKGRLFFVNTLFSCLSGVSPKHSFIPLWKPSFISKIIAEDRCHLTGVALQDDKPKYVTAASESDEKQGWTSQRKNGGVIIDVPTNEVIAKGLSMPHSPRFYQNKLWVLNSGTGYLGYVDIDSGTFNEVAFCPGYLRGLSFIGNYAVVGVCRPRTEDDFSDLLLEENLKKSGAEAESGIYIIDLEKGTTVQHILFDRVIDEVCSVNLIPGVKRPITLGLNMPELAKMITVGAPVKPTAPGSDSKH